MNKYILLLSIFFAGAIESFSQQYTLRDQQEIAYQAQLTLNMFKDLLNVISYEGLVTEQEVRKLIRDSYTPSRSQIFFSEAAIIEDDVKPSNLSSKHKQDKAINDYLTYFDLTYKKEERATVDFYNFESSDLKQSDHLYIKVKYTSRFKGAHKEDPAPYKAVDRLAELRVERGTKGWKTFITSIIYYKPEKPLSSGEDNVLLAGAGAEGDVLLLLAGEGGEGNETPSGDNRHSGGFSEKKKQQDAVFNNYLEAGKAALAADRLDEAFTAFSEAEKIYPFHQELWQNLKELTKAQNLKFSSPEQRFAYAKSKAEKAYAARDYLQAKKFYAEAMQLKQGENSLEPLLKELEEKIQSLAIPESKFSVGQYEAAIKDYNQAIRKDKNNPDYYYGRGKCYEELNKLKEAFKDYSKAIELDRNFIEALRSRASLYAETNQYHKAVADYTRILSSPANTGTIYPERAVVKRKMGDLNGAIEDYNAALRMQPGMAEYHYEKGIIFAEQNKKGEAISAFGEAINTDPAHARSFYRRGLLYAAEDELRAASADFRRARESGLEEVLVTEINKLAFKYFALAEGAMANKKYSMAVGNYNNALLVSPSFGRAWLRKGDAHIVLEEFDRAIASYSKAGEYNELSFALFKKGQALEKKGDEEAAVKEFRRYIPTGKELVARAKEGKSIEKNPVTLEGYFEEEMPDACYALGYAQLMSNRFVEALDNLDMAIHSRRFFPEAYFARGAALYALEDYRRAVKDMEESIRMGLSDPVVFYSLGRAYEANEQFEDAVLSFTHTIKTDPEYSAAYKERGICYNKLGRYGLALEDIKKAMALDNGMEKDVILMANKGLSELSLGKLREANKSLDEALRLNGDEGWALYGKACALIQEQKTDEALKLYEKAFRTGSISWAAIKNDPLISAVSKQRDFKQLVKTWL